MASQEGGKAETHFRARSNLKAPPHDSKYERQVRYFRYPHMDVHTSARGHTCTYLSLPVPTMQVINRQVRGDTRHDTTYRCPGRSHDRAKHRHPGGSSLNEAH